MPADEDTPASADPAPAARDLAAEAKVGKFEVRLEALLVLGGLVALVGAIAGLFLAFRAKVAPCEDGHYFPPGTTDFNCYAHPHAIIGCTLIGASLFAGIVLAVIGLTARLLISELLLRHSSSTAAISAKSIGTMSEI